MDIALKRYHRHAHPKRFACRRRAAIRKRIERDVHFRIAPEVAGNGRLFGEKESIDSYCRYILDVFSSPRRYKELALSSFQEYRARLNWASAGSAVNQLLRHIE